MALENWKPKGGMCDGQIHVPIREVIERGADSWKYRHLKELKKLANNPILSDDAKNALWKAVHDFEAEWWWRKLYIRNVNHDKPLHEKKNKTTKVYTKYGEDFCETCGQSVCADFFFCPGCGKEIDWD